MSNIKENYKAFVTFFESIPIRRDDEYVTSLLLRGFVRKRRRSRTLLEIVEQIGQGHEVKDWKRKCVQSEIIDSINSLCERKMFYVDSDLLDINYIFLGTFVPVFQTKQRITTWQDANIHGCLRSYFGKEDFLLCTEGVSEEFCYSYSGDYYDYVRTFPMRDRILLYRNYLRLNSIDIPIGKNSFDHPKYFVGVTERQFAEYGRIIDLIEDNSRLFVVGDGVGVMSMICYSKDRSYHSVEKNGIGSIAVKLGLISEISVKDENIQEDDILLLANVEEYLSDADLAFYVARFSKIVVITESRVSRIGDPVPGSDKKIYQVGVSVGELNPLPIARVAGYLDVRQPLCPVDEKSKLYAESLGMETSLTGFRIAYGNKDGCFNIRNRKYPSNLRYARKGDVKIYKGVKFKFEEDGQGVLCADEYFRYYPYDLDNPMILLRGKYREDGDLIVASVLRPRQIRKYVDDHDMVQSIYFMFSKQVGDQIESYYSKKNVGVASVVDLDGYVIKGEG